MELSLTYYGKVTDTVKIYRSKEMTEMIIRNFAGKDIELTIQRKRKRRSLMHMKRFRIPQNILLLPDVSALPFLGFDVTGLLVLFQVRWAAGKFL